MALRLPPVYNAGDGKQRIGQKMRQNVELALRKAAARVSQGQPLAAATVYADILKTFPSNGRARSGLTEIDRMARAAIPQNLLPQMLLLLRNGRAAEVVSAAERLSPAAQGSADLQAILGQAQSALGRQDKAVAHLDMAALLQPAVPAHWIAAGNAAYLTGHWARAEQCFETALALSPDNADSLNNLGMAVAAQGRFADADAVFDKAARLDPSNTKVAYNRANALRDAGRHQDAIAAYRQALDLDPAYAAAANNLGTLLHQLGRDAEAEAAYLLAVTARPDYAQAHRNLSAVHRYKAGDPLIATLDAQLEAAMDLRARVYLSFARSKAHEDMGEYPGAFDLLVQANALRRQVIGYDFAVDELLYSTLHRLFATPLAPLAAKDAEPRPVFVLGMMRSGTTLVEQILSSHSQVQGAGELETLGQLCLPVMERFHADGQRPSHDVLTRLRRDYLGAIAAVNGGKAVVTDKMPVNFRWIGFIMAALPEARIIHLRRDPVATCWSIFKHYFSSDGNGYACTLRDVAAYWHLYTGLMAHWHQLYPGRILDVPYEALTEDPETWSRRIVAHAGLDWQPECLNFHLNSRAVKTASASQVRQAIYRGSSDAWRKYEAQLGPLVAALTRTA